MDVALTEAGLDARVAEILAEYLPFGLAVHTGHVVLGHSIRLSLIDKSDNRVGK
jgi:hypothetical protein